MSYLVKLNKLSKSYGSRIILEHINLVINRGERLALVGENGSGKSTLAKILLKQETFDEGQLELSSSIQMGYLPQNLNDQSTNLSIEDYLKSSIGNIKSLQLEMQLLEARMSNPEIVSEELTEVMQKWNDLHEKLEQKGGYNIDYRFKEVLQGLDLNHLPLNTMLALLSGGERTRVALASLLLLSPDLLILDEPTNHLDFKALEWLEQYLQKYSGAILLISHDRMFINQIVTSIIELHSEKHNLNVYHGNYEHYLLEKKKEKERLLKEYEEKKEEIASLNALIKGKTFSKAKQKGPTDRNFMAYDQRGEKYIRSESRIINQAKDRLEELEKEPLVHPFPKTIKGIKWHPDKLNSTVAISFSHLSKDFLDRPLFENIEGMLNKGDRIILLGSNGCGKSTFLKILMGIEDKTLGTINIAPSASLGYLDQDLEQINSQNTVFDEMTSAFNFSETELKSQLHKSGLLKEGILKQKIGSLSLGQRKKLLILKLMLSNCNVLLLDEPANHLDFKTLEEFEESLLDFTGAIIAVSHDRWFNNKIGTHFWKFEQKKLMKMG